MAAKSKSPTGFTPSFDGEGFEAFRDGNGALWVRIDLEANGGDTKGGNTSVATSRGAIVIPSAPKPGTKFSFNCYAPK